MKVLLADKLDVQVIQDLTTGGFQVIQTKGLAPGNLPSYAVLCEILIVRSTLVKKEILADFPQLKLIIRAGAGIDTIDVVAAAARGIQVSNCPGKNADAVAEMALALMLAVDRNLVEATMSLRGGRWIKGSLGQGRGFKDRTLGIAGFGAVGKALARKARGLEMRIAVWSHHPLSQVELEVEMVCVNSIQDLAQVSDVVSIHVASIPETRNLFGKDFFSMLKPGAIFINTARGEVVDQVALLEAIQTRGLRVGLDVFAGEPKVAEAIFSDGALAAKVVCSPHLGASTDQAAEAVAQEVIRIATVFRDTGIAPNAFSP